MSDASQLASELVAETPESRASDEAPAPDPLVGQLLDSRYRVIERLAEGGMGTVYRAEHVGLQKEVAIKLVQDAANSDHALRFMREAMLTSRIDHPNVISAIDYGTYDQGAAYLVMSLVEGPTLARAMRSDGPMAWMRAADIGAQIADAVAAAQAQGIVHRDLKPENIVLQSMPNGTEVVKVLDFGIAKYSRDSLAPPEVRDTQHVTQMGVVVGTPGYMAPEQAVGMRADYRADLYAIGVMLWECVAGRRLWDTSDVQQLLTAQLGSRPPLLRVETGDPSIPEAFERLVAMLLATRPENRPESAVETRDQLRALIEAERRDMPRDEALGQPLALVPPRPPDTDTVFIDAAIAGWRASASEAPAATQELDEPPTTRVLQPNVANEPGPPTTQIGFHGARAASVEPKLVEPADASAIFVEGTTLLEESAGDSELATNDADVDVIAAPRAFRPYLTVPLALAGLAAMLWAAIALDSSPNSPASGSARTRETQNPERNITSASALAESHPSPNAARALPALASTPPSLTRSTSPTGAGLHPAPIKRDPPAATARANTDRELSNALRVKARSYFRRAEFELAAQTYRLAVKAAPAYAGAYAGLGASQLALGDAHGAIDSYKQAIKRAPASSGFHAALGRAYVMARDKSRAIAEYRKAVALDPANEIASKALARLTP